MLHSKTLNTPTIRQTKDQAAAQERSISAHIAVSARNSKEHFTLNIYINETQSKFTVNSYYCCKN